MGKNRDRERGSLLRVVSSGINMGCIHCKEVHVYGMYRYCMIEIIEKKMIGEFQSQDREYILESPILPENHGRTG